MNTKSMYKPHKSVTILGVNITVTPRTELLKELATSLNKDVQFFISTPNPEIITMAARNPHYKTLLNNSDIAVPDGVGVTLALRLLYGLKIKRIRGRELFLDILDIANNSGHKVFVLGGSDEVNKKALEKINQIYPNIKVRGRSDIQVYVKSNFDIKNNINNYIDIINSINKFKPHVLFVALGAPKQEIWINKYKNKIDAKLLMTVGGSLDYFVGEQIVPPNLVSNLGFEWLWRLIFQPTRLHRIFNATVVFPVLIIIEKFKKTVDNKGN